MNEPSQIPAVAREPSNVSLLGTDPLGWRRYLSIYGALWKNAVAREMGFKSNFLLWIVVEMLWFVLQLSFVGVIYLHTDHIADWSKWQVVALMSTSHLIQQVFTALFLSNCTQLSELIRTGKLDFLLLLPINTRFIISLRQVDLGSFANAGSASVVLIYAVRQLHLHPTFGQIAGFVVLCATGVLIHYSLLFLLASVSFWTVRAQGIVWGYYNLFNIARLPDSAFKAGAFKAFFTFALPMLLVSNVPAKVLLEKLNSWRDLGLIVIMSVVCALVSEWWWRRSLARYASASS